MWERLPESQEHREKSLDLKTLKIFGNLISTLFGTFNIVLLKCGVAVKIPLEWTDNKMKHEEEVRWKRQ